MNYTKFLCHFDGADGGTILTDVSSSQHTISLNDNAQLDTAQKKFGTASLLLDGTGDFLTVPDSADFDFGSGNFTIDCWVRFNAVSGNMIFISQWESNVSKSSWVLFYNHGATELRFLYSTDGTTTSGQVVKTWTPSTGTWYHIAIVRNGTNMVVYIDGVGGTPLAVSTDTISNQAIKMKIGTFLSDGNESSFMNGWMDEIRVSKGIARWTADFTPPIEQYNVENTKLLLHFDGTDGAVTTTDSSQSKHVITFEGTAQLDTAQKVFGVSSLLLDGNSDYITAPDSNDWRFQDRDWTIDFRVRFTSVAASQGLWSQSEPSGNQKSLLFNWIQSTNEFRVLYSTDGSTMTTLTFSWTPSADTWYHIAVVRSGTNCYVFVDGTQIGSTATMTGSLFNSTTTNKIGRTDDAAAIRYLDGWVDEFRVSHGIARWTANFTPPTIPYGLKAKAQTVIVT